MKHFTDGLNLLGKVAFDILLFLANNPEYKTASDIVEYRGIKANLVSVNVDKLVHDRYLKWRKNRKFICGMNESAKKVLDAYGILF